MDWWAILLSVFLVTMAVYLYRTMTFFKNTGIPHESPWPIVGSMAPVLFRKLHFVEQVLKYYKRWPEAKYFGFYDCVTPVIIVRDVELIKSIGVKCFDSFMNHRRFIDEDTDPLFGKSLFSLKDTKWKEVRSLLTPSFTASKMRVMFELISTCSKQFSEFITASAKEGVQDVEIKEAFSRFANDVIASCAFGISVDSMRYPDNEFYCYGKKSTTFTPFQISKIFFNRSFPTLSKILNVRIFERNVVNFFANLVSTTIEMRQKNGISRPDMLQLMMEQNESGKYKMDMSEMTSQAFIFFFAGFDTSSSLLSFMALAMAFYPEIQNKLLEEVDEVTATTNGNPNYETINNMQYLDAVLYETLRYYPVIGVLDRLCTGTYELPPAVPGAKPFTVKPGMNIWVPVYGIHTDPQYYDNPDIFDPNRFLGKKMSTSIPEFLGFGIGPRSCIGNRFALLENKLVIYHLLSKCRFEKSSKLQLPIKFKKSSLLFTVLVEGGFWVKVVPRK